MILPSGLMHSPISLRQLLPTLLLPLALSGCAVDSDFVLDLVPRTLDSQDIFAAGGDVKVIIHDGEAVIDVFGPDTKGVRPLSGEYVGLLVEDAGGPQDSFERFRMQAYGQVGPLTLSTGEQQVTRLSLIHI